MKKALGVFMVSIMIVVSVSAQTPSPVKSINYATEGHYPEEFLKGRMRVCGSDSMVLKDSRISGPNLEVLDDSIILSYTFAFEKAAQECIHERIAVFEMYDQKMNFIKKYRVQLSQFDTLLRLFIFFADKEFDSKGCFVQLKIPSTDPSKEYVTPFYILPSRFNQD